MDETTKVRPAAVELGDLDTADLARVEVLRGPQGTLYGASSLGGLIKFVTKDPNTHTLSGRIETGINRIDGGTDGSSLRAELSTAGAIV